jgi:hypothetical protein
MTPPISLFTKVAGLFPSRIREACAILIATALYLWSTPYSQWNWFIIGLLLPSAVTLLLAHLGDRRKQPREEVYWADVRKLADVCDELGERVKEDNPEPYKFSQLQSMGREWLCLEISESCPGGFRSHLQKVRDLSFGGIGLNEAPASFLMTEVPQEQTDTRWWKGHAFRVGLFTTADGTTFDWFTTDPRIFLRNRRQPTSSPNRTPRHVSSNPAADEGS